MNLIDELERLAEMRAKASPTKWGLGDWSSSVVFGLNNDGTGIALDCPDDAAFVAAAGSIDFPALLREAREMREELAATEQARQWAVKANEESSDLRVATAWENQLLREENERLKRVSDGFAKAANEVSSQPYREAAEAYRDLATCYRMGKSPSEALHNRLEKANRIMKGMQ